MLHSPTGTTIAAMMKATGWQQHSVRGFLAGVVRKKLKLKLDSKKIDGNRVYSLDGADSAEQAPAIEAPRGLTEHASCEGWSGSAGAPTLDFEIARLRDLDVCALRVRWHNVLGRRTPPHLPQHLMFRVLAYRLQAERPAIWMARADGCLRNGPPRPRANVHRSKSLDH